MLAAWKRRPFCTKYYEKMKEKAQYMGKLLIPAAWFYVTIENSGAM